MRQSRFTQEQVNDCGLADSVLLYCCCTEFLIDKGFRDEE